MRVSLSVALFVLFCYCAKGQGIDTQWYSETKSHGLSIQNSFPKGGPYKGPITGQFNYSYLVFFTRVSNESEKPLELSLHFSADSIPIPHSPNTFMKLFLPPDTMTLNKRGLFSYGLTELASFDHPTSFQRKLDPQKDCLFYVVAIFYQTKAEDWSQERGGNRAELVVKGQDLFYNMPPQLDALPCGKIIFDK